MVNGVGLPCAFTCAGTCTSQHVFSIQGSENGQQNGSRTHSHVQGRALHHGACAVPFLPLMLPRVAAKFIGAAVEALVIQSKRTGLARTIYIRCIYVIFGREIT